MVQFPAQSSPTERQLPPAQMLQGPAPAGEWLHHGGVLVEPGLDGDRLQLQLAHLGHHAQQLQADGSGLPGLDVTGQAQLIAAENHLRQPSWLPFEAACSIQAPANPQFTGNWVGPVGLKDSIGQRGVAPSPVAFPQNRATTTDVQSLAVARMRREVARLLTELENAEREILRQKGLREAERVEFTEAKDRLKHSWANDRDDFARVKTMLKMKNAEHHAQSGRLSQQLKHIESCNRGLRELAARHGLSIPPELEASQARRSNNGFGRSKHLTNGQTSASLSPVHDENLDFSGRISVGSCLRNGNTEASSSLPTSSVCNNVVFSRPSSSMMDIYLQRG